MTIEHLPAQNDVQKPMERLKASKQVEIVDPSTIKEGEDVIRVLEGASFIYESGIYLYLHYYLGSRRTLMKIRNTDSLPPDDYLKWESCDHYASVGSITRTGEGWIVHSSYHEGEGVMQDIETGITELYQFFPPEEITVGESEFTRRMTIEF